MGLKTLAHKPFPFVADNAQHRLQTATPDHQTTLNFSPLLLAKHTVRGPVHEEFLTQLRQLTLDQPGTDGVNHPLLHVLRGDAQRCGDAGVGERARWGRSGQGGESEQTQLVLQGLAGISQHTTRDRGQRSSGHKGIVGIERVRGEDLEEFKQSAVAGAEGLNGIGGGQRGKVEDGRVLQSSSQGPNSQLTGLLAGGLVGGNGLQSLNDVGLGEFGVTSSLGGISHGEMQFLGLLLVEFPSGQPSGQLGSQLGLEGLEGVDGAGLADDSDQSQQDMVATGVGRGEGVEHGGEDGDGQGGAVLRGAGDGFGEVGADAREEHVSVGGLVDEVDKEVVGRGDFYSICQYFIFVSIFFFFRPSIKGSKPTLLGSSVQAGSTRHQFFQNLIALFQIRLFFILFLLTQRLEEGSDVGLNVGGLILAQGIEVLGELLREFGERALDEEGSGRSGHDEDGGSKNEKKEEERVEEVEMRS